MGTVSSLGMAKTIHKCKKTRKTGVRKSHPPQEGCRRGGEGDKGEWAKILDYKEKKRRL